MSDPYAADFIDYSYQQAARALVEHPIDTSSMGSKRQAVVGWMIEVQSHYRLRNETLHLAVYYFDRYVTVNRLTVSSREEMRFGQALAVTCFHLASKMEEVYPPLLSDWSYISDHSVSEEEITNLELVVLQALGYRMHMSTAVTFIDHYIARTPNPDEVARTISGLTHYWAKKALMSPKIYTEHPDDIARGCLIWTDDQTLMMGSTDPKLDLMLPWLREVLQAPNSKHFKESLPNPALFISPIKKQPSQGRYKQATVLLPEDDLLPSDETLDAMESSH